MNPHRIVVITTQKTRLIPNTMIYYIPLSAKKQQLQSLFQIIHNTIITPVKPLQSLHFRWAKTAGFARDQASWTARRSRTMPLAT
jgi:hypothetical protein